MQEELQKVKFFLAECSLKEARKRHSSQEDLYVVDIGKIIKDLGYDMTSLSRESEFVINYSIQKTKANFIIAYSFLLNAIRI